MRWRSGLLGETALGYRAKARIMAVHNGKWEVVTTAFKGFSSKGEKEFMNVSRVCLSDLAMVDNGGRT
jgi:hypothetical protein